MSAIFGILRFDGHGVAARDLERMGNVLAHRGPDGRKSAVLGPVGLGHCLMRVNAEDLFEAQPLRDAAADVTLVADLRLDNREELAAALAIEPDARCDMPDSALLLRAYGKWGKDCAEYLLGDFAFAIWDGRRRMLTLARDHMGQRALLYHRGDGFIAFASEVKGLWALADVPRRISEDDFGLFLLRRMDASLGATLYAGISGLPGGGTMTVDTQGSANEWRYWEPRADPAHLNRDEAYYVATYRKVIEEAVACRLRRLTRPAALMLSGGFDSAAIAGLAGPVVAAQKRKLIALTTVVSDAYRGSQWDIRRWIEACRRVMPHLDVRYLEQRPRSPLADLERHMSIADGPAGVGHQWVHRFPAEAAQAGARLMMDGLGGDYTINPRGNAALAYFLRRGQLHRFLRELRPHMRLNRRSWAHTIALDILLPLLPRGLVNAVRRRKRGSGDVLRKTAMNRGYVERLLGSDAMAPDRLAQMIPPTRMRARIALTAANVSKTAPAGSGGICAAYGVELTRPFHDKRVVELGLALPEDLYVKDGRNRYLACRALIDVYPPELLTRSRSNDGATPDAFTLLDGIRSELLSDIERLSGNLRVGAYVDLTMVRRTLSKPLGSLRTADVAAQSIEVGALLASRFLEWFDRGNER